MSVLKSLEANKFVAVIGASGSGKSSLIYCGVIPDLVAKLNKKWVAVATRPGTSPIKNLIGALKAAFPDRVTEYDNERLISGELLVQQWIKEIVPPGLSLLLVVDQFEEIFRYKKAEGTQNIYTEIEKFIELIHTGCTTSDRPIHVVLTMRSDFIGECSVFQDLTELINSSNYLIPQMTREDFRKAIEGPVKIGGAKIDKALVDQLLDEVGNSTDQLPVLQHALMRTWDYWMLQNDPQKPISTGDYEAIGRMEKALSDHANEAYDELNEEERLVCENLFKTITEKGGDNRGVRRPAKIERIAAITRRSPDEIVRITEVFREKGRTFLTPFHPVELEESTVVDISHESLMRIWDRLRLWVDEEAASVQMYKKLSEASALYQEGTTGLWRPPDLQLALNWRDNQQPTAAWAVQYNPAFERAMVYLDTSEVEFRKEEENKIRLQRRRLKVTRMFSLVLGGIAVVAMGLFLWTRDLQSQAEARRIEAEVQTELAKKNEAEAQRQQEAADIERQKAVESSRIAEEQRILAEKQRIIADEKTIEAQEQQRKAATSAEEALKAQLQAQDAAELAESQRLLAEQARQEAMKRRMLSIAQSMAVKSEQMRTDTLLKGMLAYQAYSFNRDFEGISYDPDIFRSAYSGLKFFKGDDYNVYKGHTSIVRTMAESNDLVLSGGSDGQVISWNMAENTSSVLLSNLSIVKKLIVARSQLICLTNNKIVEYNMDNAVSDSYSFPDNAIKDIFLTRTGKYILVYDNRLNLADDYRGGGTEFYNAEDRINVARYDKTTGNLFVALSNGKIYFWKNFSAAEEKPQLLATIPDGNWGEINYNPQKNIVAAGTGNNQGAIYMWDVSTGNQIASLRGHTAKITGISYSSDGELMASGSYDGSVRIWRLNDLNTLPIVYDDHSSWVTSVMFTGDNRHVLSGDRSGNIKALPIEINSLIDEYCGYLTRELSEIEWHNYVGTDIEYNPAKCNDSQ